MERDSEAAELGELRRRAYGPDGGLDTNDAQRLAQLEAEARRRAELAQVAGLVDSVDSAEGHSADDDPFAGMREQQSTTANPVGAPGDVAVVDGSTAGQIDRPRRRRAFIAVGAAALVCGFAFGGIVGALNSDLLRPPAEAVLRPLASPPDDDQLVSFAGRGGIGEPTYFESFGALTPVVMQTDGQSPCLLIAVEEAAEGYVYPIAYGCAAAAWPAVADINPLLWGGGDPLMAEIADGAALRFELVGDVVEVRTASVEVD